MLFQPFNLNFFSFLTQLFSSSTNSALINNRLGIKLEKTVQFFHLHNCPLVSNAPPCPAVSCSKASLPVTRSWLSGCVHSFLWQGICFCYCLDLKKNHLSHFSRMKGRHSATTMSSMNWSIRRFPAVKKKKNFLWKNKKIPLRDIWGKEFKPVNILNKQNFELICQQLFYTWFNDQQFWKQKKTTQNPKSST